MTPFTCWKTACTPQKQPPATTAACRPDTGERAASTSGAGTGSAFALQPAAPRSHPATIKVTRNDDDIGFPFPDQQPPVSARLDLRAGEKLQAQVRQLPPAAVS